MSELLIHIFSTTFCHFHQFLFLIFLFGSDAQLKKMTLYHPLSIDVE